MSIRPNVNGTGQRSRGLGAVLADFAAGMSPGQATSAGPGIPPIMNTTQGVPLPSPVPRIASASAAAGGLATSPTQGGEPVRPASGAPQGGSGISKGQIIAGIFADALAGAAGQPGPMAARWAKEREQQQEQAQWSRQRQGHLDDYRAQKEIDAQYPGQRTPHYFEANNGDRYAIGPDGKPQRIFQDTTPKIQFIPNGLGGVIPVNVSAYTQGLTGGQPAAAPPPVLDALPPGAKPLGQGGAGSSAPRTFRR
jgi:hypothetical protein